MNITEKLKHKITTRQVSGEIKLDRIYRNLIKQAVFMTLQSESVEKPCVVNVLITDDKGIRSYNKKYRGVDKATDVLSFPMQSFSYAGWNGITDIDIDMDTQTVPLGDIILSVQSIKRQARDYGHTFLHESVRMIVHSTLHLLGYEHENPESERKMEEKEETIVKYMGYF